jgi:chemotaxis protein MotB
MASRIRTDSLNVWPAFTDTMLAFVLVLVVALAFQVAKAVEVEDPIDGGEGIRKMQEDQRAVQTRVTGAGYAGVEVPNASDVLQSITFGSDVTFVSGSADLSPQGLDLVKTLSAQIVDPERPVCSLREIQVQGHTDTVPTGSTAYTNWELSANRALRVVRELIRGGVDPERISMSATGYGQFQPRRASSNLDENRRIELTLIYTADPALHSC